MRTKKFWIEALERAVKTVAQTAVATIGAAAVVESVDWTFVASASGLAGIVSVLTSIGSSGFGPVDTPSTV